MYIFSPLFQFFYFVARNGQLLQYGVKEKNHPRETEIHRRADDTLRRSWSSTFKDHEVSDIDQILH